MNWLRRILARGRPAIELHPDPAYRARRLAQFSPQRRQRYRRNVLLAGLPDPLP